MCDLYDKINEEVELGREVRIPLQASISCTKCTENGENSLLALVA
jgi:hypothetical protein